MGSTQRCPRPAPKEASGSRPVSAATGQDRLLHIRPRIRLRRTGRCKTRPALLDMWSGRCSYSRNRHRQGTGRSRRPSPRCIDEGRHRRSSRARCMPVAPHRCSTRPPSLPRCRPLGSPRPPDHPVRPRPDSSTRYQPRPPRGRDPAPRPATRPDGVHEARKSCRVAVQVSDQRDPSETAAERRASVCQPVTSPAG